MGGKLKKSVCYDNAKSADRQGSLPGAGILIRLDVACFKLQAGPPILQLLLRIRMKLFPAVPELLVGIYAFQSPPIAAPAEEIISG